MLRWLWDLLFTRSQWKIIDERNLVRRTSDDIPHGTRYVLQDQWGNIKQKDIKSIKVLADFLFSFMG